ncbi:MAG: ribosomal protein S18-alanine N-acetyltransferase [Beijerinckiaceae bacterium]|nr:ribosomal protein S18-alanine N-acetyltransferase [Beijerinckiaceae bacterium]
MRLWPRSSIYCRPARVDDAHALTRLHTEGFERGWSTGEFEQLLSDRSVLGVVSAGGFSGPNGFALARMAADEAEILSIAVARSARRQGIGAALLTHLISSLAQNRIAALFLEVEEENAAAIALYRHFGFAEVGKRKSYYKRADGSSPAALVMRRSLA